MDNRNYLSLQLIRLTPPEERIVGGNGDGFCFVCPTGGAGKYSSGQVIHALRPGDVLVVNGSGQGKVCVGDRVEISFWFFTTTLDQLVPLFEWDEICRLRSLAEELKTTRLYPANSQVAIDCHKLLAEVPACSGPGQRGHLLRVVSVMLSAELKKLSGEGFLSAEQHMVRVFEKLSTADLLGLSVNDLATKFGCSRRHLNRLFHQHFGVSISTLRMEMRLLKATSLLRDPGAKVINVAQECGFNHVGLFNSCFKRRFNLTPGEWRKRSLKSHPPSMQSEANKAVRCRIRKLGLCPWADRKLLRFLQSDGDRSPAPTDQGPPQPGEDKRAERPKGQARRAYSYKASHEGITIQIHPQP